mgnify:CR=1 FL=1
MEGGGKGEFFRFQLGDHLKHDRVTPLFRDLQICEALHITYKQWMDLHEDERYMWRMYMHIKYKKEEERRVEEHNRRELERQRGYGV